MRIKFIEIQNFRRLKSVRIDFAEETTLFVGANNSGKTSAMVVLGHFLIDKGRFTTKDFTLSTWSQINKIGKTWQEQCQKNTPLSLSDNAWQECLPSLDVWISVEDNEIYHVSHMLPTLEWEAGLLGVRLRFEPEKIEELHKEFLAATTSAEKTLQAAPGNAPSTLKLWPRSMEDFLNRRLSTHFVIRAYILNPKYISEPTNGKAIPQDLPPDCDFLDVDPFRGLIRIDQIRAQRGFSDVDDAKSSRTEDGDHSFERGRQQMLSEQLRGYYKKHLDPSDLPEPSDIPALQAVESAQESFDERLKKGFEKALLELGELGYPGVTDPKLNISTKLQPIEGLKHASAVEYDVLNNGTPGGATPLRLPEQYNGLGYQNLISIVFKLMSFRDDWMKVGKAQKKATSESPEEIFYPLLHLVLIEEPEAHLHAQVQQVFFRKAYSVLRNHSDLGKSPTLRTQLVVSTHSSHITHECEFSYLRYFRRQPAAAPGKVPESTVANLSEVFGANEDTTRFVTRYLKTTHCDLFFADAAILVEGPAERMLVPLFIRESFPKLNESYITVLEIGGSHAHRLRPLIEHLGLTTLIITDLDATDPNDNRKAVQPCRGKGQLSGNTTLASWIPKEIEIDTLLGLGIDSKIASPDANFSIRVAYQTPTPIDFEGKADKALSNTFEDSLVFENLPKFRDMEGGGLIKSFKNSISESSSISQLGTKMFNKLKTGKKAQFALDLLELGPQELKPPAYINEGLEWLQEQLKRKQEEILGSSLPPESASQEAK